MGDPVPPRRQWEYMYQEMFGEPTLNIARLNTLGRAGWEVVHVSNRAYLLKREVIARPRQPTEMADDA